MLPSYEPPRTKGLKLLSTMTAQAMDAVAGTGFAYHPHGICYSRLEGRSEGAMRRGREGGSEGGKEKGKYRVAFVGIVHD